MLRLNRALLTLTSLAAAGLTLGGFTAPAAAEPAPAAAPPPASPAPAPAAGVKFGILGIGPASLSSELAAKLETAAANGLTASGAEVLPHAATIRPAGSCETPDCIKGVAHASGARYLLRGSCELEASTYRVRLDLVDGETGAVASTREDKCEICTEPEVVEATGIAASTLKSAFDREHAGEATRPPFAGTDLSTKTKSGPAALPMWRRAAPWVAFAVAAGAIGTGIYYLSQNGKNANCIPDTPCQSALDFYDVNHTALEGGALLAGGAVAGALGALALVWNRSAPPGDASSAPVPASPTHTDTARPLSLGFSVAPSGASAWTTF